MRSLGTWFGRLGVLEIPATSTFRSGATALAARRCSSQPRQTSKSLCHTEVLIAWWPNAREFAEHECGAADRPPHRNVWSSICPGRYCSSTRGLRAANTAKEPRRRSPKANAASTPESTPVFGSSSGAVVVVVDSALKSPKSASR